MSTPIQVRDRTALAERLFVLQMERLGEAPVPSEVRRVAKGVREIVEIFHDVMSAPPESAPLLRGIARLTDPRRTPGAVVTVPGGEWEYIVVAEGLHAVQCPVEAPWHRNLNADDDDVFARWATRAECARHGVPYVERGPKGGLSLEQGTPMPVDDVPAAPDAVTYAPRVGDAVNARDGRAVIVGRHRSAGNGAETAYFDYVYVEGRRKGQRDFHAPPNIMYAGPATPEERAIAGLPPLKTVDRVALAKAIYAAVAASNPTLNGKPWDEAKDVTKRDAFNAADAVIAYFNGGAAGG